MRYRHLLSEEQLDELRMSPGALKKFASSDEAEGILAGFEAELVFTGLGEEEYEDEDWEPDYDADERAYSLSQVIDFFDNDEFGYGMTDRERGRLEEQLDEVYYEWYDEQVNRAFRDEAEDLVRKVIEDEEWDWDDAVRNQLDDMGLSDDEIEEAMKQGQAAPKFTKSSEQETYAQENPGYQRYLEAYEAAESILEDLVAESVEQQDKYWDAALDDFRDNYSVDDDSSFFSDVGLRWMSDVAEQFDLGWPVWSSSGGSRKGGYSEDNAQNLATDLEEVLGVKTRVASGYHTATRDKETWIFEPDASLNADDSDNMPVEIISPPMPLSQALETIPKFFEWAESNGAYANSSTGFHMSVSLPHTGGETDYLKLALFLGDEYVLTEFGRVANTYCVSAMRRIKDRLGIRRGNTDKNTDIAGAMDLMRHNLIELAQKTLGISSHGFEKFTSINPKGGNDSTRVQDVRRPDYIEFRSAGGTNYFEDTEKLQNTLMRYARAMSIAANPNAERREYYTKLYKLLTPSREATGGVELFSEFASGKITKEELKRRWAESTLAKDAPEYTQKDEWQLIDRQTKKAVPGGFSFSNFTRDEARERAKARISPGASDKDFDLNYEIVPFNSGKWEIYAYDPDFDEEETTLEIVDAPSRTKAAEEVYDKYNAERIPFKVRPYYGAIEPKPEPKLTPRAQLAKRIKQPGRIDYNYEIVKQDDYRLPVVDKFYAATEQEAQEVYSRWLKHKDLPDDTNNYGYRPIKIQAKIGEPQPVGQARDVPADQATDWEAVYRPTGHVFDTLAHADAEQARTWAQSMGDAVRPKDILIRRVGTGAGEAEPNVAQNFERGPRTDYIFYTDDNPNQVFHRLEDATAEQALEFIRQQEADGMPPGMLRVRADRRPTYEVIDPVSGAGAVPPRPVIRPPQSPAVPKVNPAAKINIKQQPPDPYAQTYKKMREWEEIVESMIQPVGRLGQ